LEAILLFYFMYEDVLVGLQVLKMIGLWFIIVCKVDCCVRASQG